MANNMTSTASNMTFSHEESKAMTSMVSFPGKETPTMAALSKLSPPEVRKERKGLERQLYQVLQERKMIQLELDSAKEEVGLIRDQLTAEKEERKLIMQQLVHARLEKRDLYTAMKEEDDERAETQANLQLVNGESCIVTRQNETLAGEASALRGQLAMLSKARTLLADQCGIAQREVKLLTRKVAEVRRETKSVQAEQQQFTIEIKHLNAELEQEETKRDLLIDQMGLAKDERTQLRMAVCEGKRHQLALSSQVKLLESEQSKMHDCMKDSISEVKHLEGKQGVLARTKQRHATEVGLLDKHMEYLMNKVSQADSGRQVLESHMDMMAGGSENQDFDFLENDDDSMDNRIVRSSEPIVEVDSDGVEWEAEFLHGAGAGVDVDLSHLVDSEGDDDSRDGYDDDLGGTPSIASATPQRNSRKGSSTVSRERASQRKSQQKTGSTSSPSKGGPKSSRGSMGFNTSVDAISETSSRPSTRGPLSASKTQRRDSRGQTDGTLQISEGSSRQSPSKQTSFAGSAASLAPAGSVSSYGSSADVSGQRRSSRQAKGPARSP